jgi:hypothetical protein
MTEAVKPVMNFPFKDLGFEQLVFTQMPWGTSGPVELRRKRVRA